MAGACSPAASDLPLVDGLLTSVDCNVTDLVQSGYGAIAGPGSTLIAGLTVLLTIYIAVMGLRLMLGLGTLRVGDLTIAAVKIGAVLALAANWPLYHQLVFETLFRGPEQLAGQVLGGSGPDGPIHNLRGQLQSAFDDMQASAVFYAQRSPGSASPWIGGPSFAAAALNLSSVMMLMATLGVLLAARIVLAALLVAGPLFAGLLLFDATRGIFIGWLRAALALAVVPTFALLALVLQLTLIEPHLGALTFLRGQGGAETGPAIAILVITLTTTAVSLVGMVASTIVGLSLRVPGVAGRISERSLALGDSTVHGQTATATPVYATAQQPTTPRVAAIAAAAGALAVRDTRLSIALNGRSGSGSSVAGRFAERGAMSASANNHRRIARPSAAASSLRRDG